MIDTIRTVLVDDHPLMRDGIAVTLNSDPKITVVGEGSTADDAIRLTEEMMPEIILLDISMPGSGINAAKAISQKFPVVKIVMLTVSEHDNDVVESFRYGACAYILKGTSGPDLLSIIHEIYRGGSYVSPSLAARLLSESRNSANIETSAPSGISALTAREKQILERLARGLTNKEIGVELSIAEKTVKHYVTNVLQKLQVRNRVEAAIIANSKHE